MIGAMLFAAGWCVVRSSRAYDDRAPDPHPDDVALWDRLEEWLAEHVGLDRDPWLVWSLTRTNNNHPGVLQFWASRNHRTSAVWDLLDWLAANSAAYGVTYVYDDEDGIGSGRAGRGKADHSNEFRVWRLLDGRLEEFPDTLLSPYVPTIEDL